ncbi:hypothetical protein [Thalassobius sp. MITS945101]|uniref:hypothetical protein n=1 Tax=Thalassobius sp. MITS945101 TaxID=3096994 RepID=UPI00399B3A1E
MRKEHFLKASVLAVAVSVLQPQLATAATYWTGTDADNDVIQLCRDGDGWEVSFQGSIFAVYGTGWDLSDIVQAHGMHGVRRTGYSGNAPCYT